MPKITPVAKVTIAIAEVVPHSPVGAPTHGIMPDKLQPKTKKKMVSNKGTKRSASKRGSWSCS
jgi:hypothetical protein